MTTGAQVITTIHLAILAILALLVIAGIAWGTHLRRRRRAGTERREEHQAAVEAAPTTNTAPRAEQAQRQSQVQAPAPAPPPVVQAPADPLPETDRLADEPIAAAAPMEASPAAEAVATGVEAAPSQGDAPLTILKGLGPKLAVRLGELGFTTVGDIAALSPAEAEALDAQLGAFTGRMARDRWIEQARLLAAGDRTGFEAAFGRL